MKNILLLLVFLALTCSEIRAQENKAPINWMSFEEAVVLNKTAPRKLFIDVFTDWCGWCKRMDASTFRDSAVADFMNRNFYAVKLNAERKDTVIFDNKPFVYKAEYKSHELALALLNGQMSYPTFVFLDEKFAMLSPLSGYQTPEQLMKALEYFGNNIYQQKSWDEYNK